MASFFSLWPHVGFHFQSVFVYIVFVASAFVGRDASASVSALSVSLPIPLSHFGSVPFSLVPSTFHGANESMD